MNRETLWYLRETHIIEWLSKMNVKHEYVNLHETNWKIQAADFSAVVVLARSTEKTRRSTLGWTCCREHLVSEGRCGPGGSPRMDSTRHMWMGVSLSGLLSGSSPGSKGTAEWTCWSFGQLWRGHSKFVCILLDPSVLHWSCAPLQFQHTHPQGYVALVAGPTGLLSFPFLFLFSLACGSHAV